MNKSSIGILLVVLDIVLVFTMWLGYQIEGSYESLDEREIEQQTLTGSDFTVKMTGLPDYDDNVLLKAKLWKHIEDVLELRRDIDLKK
mgnify:CR=1 FL=1